MFLCDSVVDLVIQTFLFTLPLVVLPVALAWSFHLTLRLSLIFCLFHAIVALIKRLIPSLMVNVKPLLWLLEGLTLFALLFFVQPYLPLWLEIAYHYSLHYAGPAVLLLESVQVVCIVALFNQVISSKIEENPTLMKSILSAITLTCFIVAIYWVTILFQGELSIAFASYLSVTCTILIVLIILNICIEEGIISDIAIISLFVIYTTRNAALTNNISTITPFEFDSSYLFTLDFIFSVLLAIITIFSLPLTISSLWESDQDIVSSDSTTFFTYFNISEQIHYYGIVFIIIYTHLILVSTNNIGSIALSWYIIQTIICVSLYTLFLFKSSEHIHKD